MKKIHTIFKFHAFLTGMICRLANVDQISFLFDRQNIMTDRIAQLEQFLAEDANDPFNYYALALEYMGTDEQKALSLFQQLMTNFKHYLPAYYQLANFYARLGRLDEAKNIFNEGISIARTQKDLKTLRELNSALAELDDE